KSAFTGKSQKNDRSCTTRTGAPTRRLPVAAESWSATKRRKEMARVFFVSARDHSFRFDPVDYLARPDVVTRCSSCRHAFNHRRAETAVSTGKNKNHLVCYRSGTARYCDRTGVASADESGSEIVLAIELRLLVCVNGCGVPLC